MTRHVLAPPFGARTAFHHDPASGSLELVGLAGAFAATACSYVLTVLPRVKRELAHWQTQALSIPDPVLRRLALDALSKRGNMEGAALFAVLAPPARRATAIRRSLPSRPPTTTSTCSPSSPTPTR